MQLLVSRTAQKQLLKIPFKIRQKIECEIEKLLGNPLPPHCKKLSGRDGYRISIGDYRILYCFRPQEKQIIVLSAQHRKDAYR